MSAHVHAPRAFPQRGTSAHAGRHALALTHARISTLNLPLLQANNTCANAPNRAGRTAEPMSPDDLVKLQAAAKTDAGALHVMVACRAREGWLRGALTLMELRLWGRAV